MGPDEFLIAGFDAALDFKPTPGSEFTGVQGLLIEEGVYENGVWKPTNQRNGNITDGGLSVARHLIKIKLMRY